MPKSEEQFTITVPLSLFSKLSLWLEALEQNLSEAGMWHEVDEVNKIQRAVEEVLAEFGPMPASQLPSKS